MGDLAETTGDSRFGAWSLCRAMLGFLGTVVMSVG